MSKRQPLIVPGAVIRYGDEDMTVGAVGITGGERYYWLVAADGAVSMLPAFVVEPWQKNVDLGPDKG